MILRSSSRVTGFAAAALLLFGLAAGTAIATAVGVKGWPSSVLVSITAIAILACVFLGWAFRRTSLEAPSSEVLPGSGSEASDLAGLPEINRCELEVVRESLVAREKMHLEWIAYLSHDLATPLVRMLRRVETIQYDAEMSREDKEATLEQVHRDITDLAEVVGSISQFAILESGIKRCFEAVPLGCLLELVVEDFEHEAMSGGIELQLRVADDLGLVEIEKSLIKRAVENLISNAIRHTPAGGLISVSANRSEGTVDIVVEDTGTGMPVQELERVFNFAFQGEGHTRISKVGSLGLGLALVRKVAQVHSGTVTASNVEPHGARFVLSLPAIN